MNIQLLAIDLDGTLVRSDNMVSPQNKAAVKAARDLGVKVALCTGRLHCESEYVVKQLGGCDYLITCNGSVVYDLLNRRHIVKEALPFHLADKVVALLEGYDIFYQIYVDDASCVPASQMNKFDSIPLTDGYRAMFCDTQQPLNNPRAELMEKKLDVLKFFIPSYDTRLLQDIRKQAENIPGLEVTFASKHGLEIFRHGLDKLYGLSRLLDHLNMSYEHVMVLGDSENDLKIIQAAKYGVAMANAPDFVKDAAKYHTKSNEEDGVAHAITQLILEPAGFT